MKDFMRNQSGALDLVPNHIEQRRIGRVAHKFECEEVCYIELCKVGVICDGAAVVQWDCTEVQHKLATVVPGYVRRLRLIVSTSHKCTNHMCWQMHK